VSADERADPRENGPAASPERMGPAAGLEAPPVPVTDLKRADHMTDNAMRASASKPSLPNRSGLEAHLRAGHDLIPLHRYDAVINGRPRGKSPRDASWTRRTYDSRATVEEALGNGNNVGVRLRKTDLVIDVDPRNFRERCDSFVKLCDRLAMDQSAWPRIETGGGGVHYYLRKPEDVPVLDSLPEFPGVEFKSRGRQVLAAGSIHPSGRTYELDFIHDGINNPPSVPPALLDAIRRPTTSAPAEGGDLTPDRMAAWLVQLNPENFRDHDRWLELMMACHHATAGEGREEFIDWSTADPSYADHDKIIGCRWDSLHADRKGGGAVTAKTLYKRVYEAGGKEPHVPPEGDFQPIDDDATAVPGGPSANTEQSDEWVWVADADAFFSRHNGKSYNRSQFEGMFGHLVEKGSIVAHALKGKMPMRKLEALSYNPGKGDLPGDGTLNLWRPSDVEPAEGDASWFLEHAAHLVPDERERGILLDFLAYIVQRPGDKVNFAPLIQGGQGTGKSAVGILMERIVGERNVARPSNSELRENFTGWLKGKALVVVEELMAGGSRDLANKLKPLITDPRVSIREMYRPPYALANTTNFLMFTNHREAVPVDADDRRYFVVFSPAQPRDAAYYDRLFRKIAGDGAAHVAHWLLERDLSGFDAKGRAPATEAKREMRLATMGEAEAHLAELAAQGHPAFAGDLAAVEHLRELLPASLQNRTRGQVVANFLREEMGAVQLDGRSRLADGKMRVLWSLRNQDKWKGETAAARARAYDGEHHAALRLSQNDGDDQFP
jgi:hypothetical protein